MHESPLFSTPARETTAGRSARRVTFSNLRRRIARVGMIAVTVASLAGAGSAAAAPPFDAQGCTTGNAACIATGGVLYPYLANPNVYLGNGGVNYGAGYPYGYGYGYGYGSGVGYGYGTGAYGYSNFGYGSYGYLTNCANYGHDCDLPGTAGYGFLVYPPPTAKPFSAYPSTALVTPTPFPVYLPPPAPPAPPTAPALPAAVAVTPVASSVTATPATATIPATPQTIIVPPVGAPSTAATANAAVSGPIIVPPYTGGYPGVQPSANSSANGNNSGNTQPATGGSTMGAASGAVQTGGSGSSNTNPTGGSVPGRVGSP